MNIHAEKLGLIKWIAGLNDSSVIEKLKRIYEEDSKVSDWWNELSLSEKESIEKGLSDIENGRVYSYETAKKIYEKYI